MKIGRKGIWLAGILTLLALVFLTRGSSVRNLSAAERAAAAGLAGLTPEPESYLPLVAKQPTLTPTPTPTQPPTPTPTHTPTPQPTVIVSAQYCHGPFIPIPDVAISSLNDTITISESGNIVDLDIYINTAHTWVGDLRFSLAHEGTGTTRTLIDRPGVPGSSFGCLRDNISTILDDSAALPVESQCANANPTISGTFFPNQTLSSFDGENINGTWTMKVEDLIKGSGGTFNGWCMFVDFETPP